MKIDQSQPSFGDFIGNELNTLGFLREQSSFLAVFPELSSAASITYNTYRGIQKSGPLSCFLFGCELTLRIEGKDRKIFVEAKIENRYSIATYALSMCDSSGSPNQLFRKFHFDYDPNADYSLSRKPIYHLQYGGKPTPKLQHHKIDTEVLHDWLSVPRLSITPVNLALLLDMIFVEFPSESTSRIVELREWRELIKANEDRIIKPYYEVISRFITSQHRSTFLLRDFIYGK